MQTCPESAEISGLTLQIGETFSRLVKDQETQLGMEDQSIIRREEHFQAIVDLVESFNAACILIGICHNNHHCDNNKKGKKKQQEGKKSHNPDISALIGSVMSSLETLLNVNASMSKVIEVDKLCSSLQHKFSQISIMKDADPAHSMSMDALQEDIAKRLDSSYQFTFWQLKTVIQKKLDYLKSMS